MNKRKLGALVAASMLTLTFAGTALANDVHQAMPIVGTNFNNTTVGCGEGWHFVHVGAKADALPSELTATFKNAGTVKVAGYVNGNSIVMYNVHVDPSDRLLSASDDILDGANLNLSHVCLAETTTSNETTSNETTSNETTSNETTSVSESTTSSLSVDDQGGSGETTATSSTSSEETTSAGHVEGLTPPATDTIGAATSNSTVSTSLLLVLAGVLSFVLLGIPAAARKRR
jgi:hypothetical protein